MNSKAKGSRFERNISKWFTDWTGYKFQRTPMSGAYHSSQDLTSDIMCSDERHAHRCKISVECKNYRDINFEHTLLNKKGCKILEFWNQACRDANRSKKIPILCMRYNSMPRNEFFFLVDVRLAKVIFTTYTGNYMTIHNTKQKGILYVFMATDIIKKVNYKDIHKEAKKCLK